MSSEESPTVRRSTRQKFAPVIKQEPIEDATAGKKWTKEDQWRLLKCLKIHGHKNINRIVEEFPGKSADDIRKYLVVIHTQAHKNRKTIPELQFWVSKCLSQTERKNMVKTCDSMQVAQVLKFLSVDGLLEKHPKPRGPHDIDFSCAYRLLYQIVMGYPIQPVNRATAQFVCKCMTNLTNSKDVELIEKLTKMMKEKFGKEHASGDEEESEVHEDGPAMRVKMPLRVYTRKKRPMEVPHLKINVSEVQDGCADSNVKNYTIQMTGSVGSSQTIGIPILSLVKKSKLDKTVESLWTSPGFNPLELPESLLCKPAC